MIFRKTTSRPEGNRHGSSRLIDHHRSPLAEEVGLAEVERDASAAVVSSDGQRLPVLIDEPLTDHLVVLGRVLTPVNRLEPRRPGARALLTSDRPLDLRARDRVEVGRLFRRPGHSPSSRDSAAAASITITTAQGRPYKSISFRAASKPRCAVADDRTDSARGRTARLVTCSDRRGSRARRSPPRGADRSRLIGHPPGSRPLPRPKRRPGSSIRWRCLAKCPIRRISDRSARRLAGRDHARASTVRSYRSKKSRRACRAPPRRPARSRPCGTSAPPCRVGEDASRYRLVNRGVGSGASMPSRTCPVRESTGVMTILTSPTRIAWSTYPRQHQHLANARKWP